MAAGDSVDYKAAPKINVAGEGAIKVERDG
jgi:hypothetical protein